MQLARASLGGRRLIFIKKAIRAQEVWIVVKSTWSTHTEPWPGAAGEPHSNILCLSWFYSQQNQDIPSRLFLKQLPPLVYVLSSPVVLSWKSGITKPGIQWWFHFSYNSQQRLGGAGNVRGAEFMCCMYLCHELPSLSLIQPHLLLARKQTVPIHFWSSKSYQKSHGFIKNSVVTKGLIFLASSADSVDMWYWGRGDCRASSWRFSLLSVWALIPMPCNCRGEDMSWAGGALRRQPRDLDFSFSSAWS